LDTLGTVLKIRFFQKDFWGILGTVLEIRFFPKIGFLGHLGHGFRNPIFPKGFLGHLGHSFRNPIFSKNRISWAP
jgi:hypothetical protein